MTTAIFIRYLNLWQFFILRHAISFVRLARFVGGAGFKLKYIKFNWPHSEGIVFYAERGNIVVPDALLANFENCAYAQCYGMGKLSVHFTRLFAINRQLFQFLLPFTLFSPLILIAYLLHIHRLVSFCVPWLTSVCTLTMHKSAIHPAHAVHANSTN